MTHRQVKLKTFIPVEWEIVEPLGNKKVKQGTGKWTDEFTEEGIFHQWGVAYEEFETGAGNYTVALVEMPDGTVKEVQPSHLKFES